MRHRRRDAAVVVAAYRQHAAQRTAAVDVAVLERVARAVHPRALAVPQCIHAIDAPLGVERHALRAQAGCGRQVFVDGGQEVHARSVERGLGLPHLLVDHAQRAAAVAADEACGLEARRVVERALHQHQAHQRLRAGEPHRALRCAQVVAELVGAQGVVGRHGGHGGHGRGAMGVWIRRFQHLCSGVDGAPSWPFAFHRAAWPSRRNALAARGANTHSHTIDSPPAKQQEPP